MFEITEACEPQEVYTSCAVLSDLDGLEIACEHKKTNKQKTKPNQTNKKNHNKKRKHFNAEPEILEHT